MPNSNSNTFLCETKASEKCQQDNVDQSAADIVSHFIFLLCCQIKRTFREIESIPFLRLIPSHSYINVTVRKRKHFHFFFLSQKELRLSFIILCLLSRHFSILIKKALEYMFVRKNQACKSWICVCHVCHVPWFVFVKVEYVFAKCRALCSVCHVPCAVCYGT